MIRVMIAALAGAVVIFVQAGVLFGFLFADFFAKQLPPEFAGITKTSPDFAVIFLADLLYAGMLTFVFTALSRIDTFRRGASAGAVIGALVMLHFDLIHAATTHLTTLASVAANVVISAGMSAVGGGVVATVLGRLGRPTRPPAGGERR